MSDTQEWAAPESLQPSSDELTFDLPKALDAMVQLHATIPDDAFTAGILGTERAGYGAAIDNGLIVTIGYLITEAQEIWLTTNRGEAVGGWPIVYDQATGFGLIQPLGELEIPRLERGTIANVKPGAAVTVIGHGGRAHAIKAHILDKREFAGYWEYVLDEALFTAPAHPEWSGAALLDDHGRLIGIGSLLVQADVNGKSVHSNMFVPIDLLSPILDEVAKGRRARRVPRPWLGMYTQESNGNLVVAGVAPGGPAEDSGVQAGDLVLSVSGTRARSLAEFYRMVWRLGPAGVEVPLSIARAGDLLRITINSADRNDFLKKPDLH
jgi:S1-C subfamily serine protease